MAKYIKSRPLQWSFFSALCSAMEAAHTINTAHGSEVAISGASAFQGSVN
jgi:hypothetical protein